MGDFQCNRVLEQNSKPHCSIMAALSNNKIMVFKSPPWRSGGISILASRSHGFPVYGIQSHRLGVIGAVFPPSRCRTRPNQFCVWGKRAWCRVARAWKRGTTLRGIVRLHLPRPEWPHLCCVLIQREGRRNGRRRGRRLPESSPAARGLGPTAPAPWSSGSRVRPFCCDQSSPPTSRSRCSSARAPSALSSAPPPHPPNLLAVHVPLPLPSSALLLMLGQLGHGYTLLCCAASGSR